jgi:site-specific DNA-methyltransferase (adenine-specific)
MMDLNHGDCLKIMPSIPDKSIDMILCDLPYGTTACKWDVIIPFEPLWEQYNRIIKDNGTIVLNASQPFTSNLIMSNIKMFKYCWVWIKTKASGHLDAKNKPMKKHEDILVFGNKGFPNYYPQGLVDGEFKTGRNVDMTGKVYSQYKNHGTSKKGNYPKTTLEIANPSNKGNLHPTQKPVALLEYLIKTYTIENETVLDNCMGSGSTGVACINTNRNFIGIEKEENYFQIAQKRIEEAQKEKEKNIAI